MTSRCFVTHFDKKYYRYATVLLQTLADNYKKPIDVICIVSREVKESDVPDLIKSKLANASHLNIQFRSPENDYVAKAKPWEEITGYLSGSIIEKVFIASICKEYDEAVYADGDCIFVSDATKFIEHPFPNNSKIVALPEQSMIAERDLKKPEIAYFNNGVFITDLNYWRKNDLEKKMLKWMLNEKTGTCPEQTAMNVFLYDVWFPLSPNFNYWDSFSWPGLKISYPHPTLIHFVGPIKPWNSEPDNTVVKRGPHDRLWKYLYNQLWGEEGLYI